MKIVFTVLFSLISIVVIFLTYRWIKVKIQHRKLNGLRFERVKELYYKLENKDELTPSDILPYAQNLLTREFTFRLLDEHGKTHLFPEEFNTFIKAAESQLSNWLEFPTELDSCPDEVEHIKRVTFDFGGNHAHYEVFKYRVDEPH